MEKILVYALSENIGGVEEYVLNLSRYKSDKTHEYGYILLGEHSPYEEEMQKRGLRYYKVPKKKHFFKNIAKIYSLLRKLRNEYSILYINTSSLGYILPYLIASSMGYKLVLHSHLDARSTSSKLKILVHEVNYRILKKRLGQRLACSIPAAKWMFDGDADKAILIPNAINLKKFKFNHDERKKYRKKLGLEGNKVIGNVGRLTYFKNQKFLLDILEKINDDKVKLLLIGDGEDKKELISYAKKLGISSRVIFYGNTHTPQKIMNVIDCIVMPSIAEGFPITIVEAQAAGLPCVVSDVITREVNITDTVSFLSLNDSLDDWIQEIIYKVNLQRVNNDQKLRDAGFDVTTLEKRVYGYLQQDKRL